MIAISKIEPASSRLHAAALRRIVARSSTLYERLEVAHVLPTSEPLAEALQQSRIDAWCDAIAKGDFDRFQRCLSWDGITLDQAKQAIQTVTLREDAPLPDWAEMLHQVFLLMTAQASEQSPTYRFFDPQAPLPFQELFAPFVLIAQQELSRRTGAAARRLTEPVHALLERSLLGQLIDLSAQSISLTFTSWRTGQQSSFGRFLSQMGSISGRNLYLRFVQEMLQGQFVSFLEEYATLARLLITLTNLWIEAQQEFLQRLDADWLMIGERFGKDISNAQVVAIQVELSDRHRGGRSVIAFRIGDDLPLVYKPKSLGIDRAYNDLLLWLNEQGCLLPFKAVEVIDRGDYGWVEYVLSWHCADVHQVKRHYQRAGMLLCLTYVLEATDCHHENLLACGEYPVLIDLETLLQPRPDLESAEYLQTAHRIAIYQLSNSVARTALLPVWEGEDDADSSFDYSGLGSQVQQNRTYKGLQWTAVNTDQMALTLQDIAIEPSFSHMPMLDGKPANLINSIESVAEGFQQLYYFLLEKRELLLAENSPLKAMANQTIRFLFRRTNIYAKILKQLAHPNYLKDGVDRSIRLEVLKRSAAMEANQPKFWSMIDVERQSMEQLDIPMFTLQSDREILTLSSQQQVEQFFEGSGFDLMWQRLQSLSLADMSMQVQYIRAMLGLRGIAPHEMSLREQDGSAEDSFSSEILDDTALLAEAIAITQRIQDRAIHAPDGSVTWLSPQFSLQHQRFELQPTNTSLYDGKVGIALFLAALAKVTGETSYKELCLQALQDFQRSKEAVLFSTKDPNFNLNLGLSAGLASSMYGITCISRLLSDCNLLEMALDMVSLVEPDVIAQDTYLDILGGTTGILLSLITLYEMTQDSAALEAAIACGQSLLARSVPTEGGRAWRTLSGRLLTGFSHGAAGIAYALLKLAHITGDRAYQLAAEAGIAYEQSCFLPTVSNWCDLRDFSQFLLATGSTEAPPLMSSWCHGATGIGLGRLGGLTLLDNAAIRQDIQSALQTTYATLEQKREMVDQLCCGSMGRVDFLITASDRLGQPELLANARAQASQVIHLARSKGGYTAEPGLHQSIYVPGFFRGEAGIGYTLLRLIAPQQLPSILLLE
ncbi:type 2 lantipeptide synthetase LanM [Nostoc sp. C052]|uniref:type 2 lanthipeptide synthetase LanM family protein n=1 Tax=Nostoc sp. C052 TaxID=2576902 RepID=UPI0015C40B5C|nr:type 2 lanthipeptide synthetase LanM family protein [Nostoc sp. C052]QLE40179.1 type 2 lantipeptide synthetase LanM [Nostoc sp. C052]